MAGDTSLDKENREALEEERGPLKNLEEKIGDFLMRFKELKRERDELAVALDLATERGNQLERRLEILSQDREKVKTRIDQLLQRLKGIDI